MQQVWIRNDVKTRVRFIDGIDFQDVSASRSLYAMAKRQMLRQILFGIIRKTN